MTTDPDWGGAGEGGKAQTGSEVRSDYGRGGVALVERRDGGAVR